FVGADDERRTVRQPHRAARPAVPVRREVAGLTGGQVDDGEPLIGCELRRLTTHLDDRDRRAVRRAAWPEELVVAVAEQYATLAGRDVDGDHAVTSTARFGQWPARHDCATVG